MADWVQIYVTPSPALLFLTNTIVQRRMSHEQPVFFYSLVIGALGPVSLLVVPPLRAKLGYKSSEPIPLSYPGEVVRQGANFLIARAGKLKGMMTHSVNG
ncbi:hypothetical protein Clacol_008381 [Clathrus columnatus]|uniref:Uncharacterized protein n=1 Tax=Clathrus columnatus TaxID=1419009 RepID=A0AAV5AN36_9AGAM|nr:hypothetical protein Clacol_008381 [Clathrus columnatus]